MENKQLDTKDLLMNKKEELIWRVIDNVISCCAVTRIDGAKSITREDVVGKSREENVVLTRCLVVEQMDDDHQKNNPTMGLDYTPKAKKKKQLKLDIATKSEGDISEAK